MGQLHSLVSVKGVFATNENNDHMQHVVHTAKHTGYAHDFPTLNIVYVAYLRDKPILVQND